MLRHLEFGLNVTQLLMRFIITAIMLQDKTINRATSAYMMIKEDKVLATCVKKHFIRFGLTCKDLEQLENGAQVLGLQIWGKRSKL